MIEAGPFNSVGEVLADLTAEWSLEGPFDVDGVLYSTLADAVTVACYRAQQAGKATLIAGEPSRPDLAVWFSIYYRRGRWRYIAQTVWREDLAA